MHSLLNSIEQKILSVQNRRAAHLLHSFGSSRHEYLPDMSWACKRNLPHLKEIDHRKLLPTTVMHCDAQFKAHENKFFENSNFTHKDNHQDPPNPSTTKQWMWFSKQTVNRRTHFFNQRLQIRDLVITCGHTKVDTYTYLVAFHHCSADFNSIAHHHIQNTLAWATSFLSKVCFHNRTKHERIADTQNKRRWNNWIWRTNRRDARLKRKLSGSQSRQRRKLCWFDNYGAACR